MKYYVLAIVTKYGSKVIHDGLTYGKACELRDEYNETYEGNGKYEVRDYTDFMQIVVG